MDTEAVEKIFKYSIMKIISISLFFLIISLNSYSQTGEDKNDRLILGREYAEQELKETLSDSTLHNVVGKGRILIKEESDAIKISEVILFSIYTEKRIIEQRPYESYFIDNYWVISGTLPNDPSLRGGTFLIILDARNGKILRITHGK